MSAPTLPAAAARREALWQFLREEGDAWLFIARTVLSYFIALWLAMRLQLPSPNTAAMTTIIVMHRQSGMVLAKSFYRVIGTLAGALVALAIVAAFPQQRTLFLGAMALWVGLCAGGATLYRNFKSYAFVLAGYTAAIIALPVIEAPGGVFESAMYRITELMLGLLVSAVVNDVVFPVRVRDTLRQTARQQYRHFIDFMRGSTAGAIPRGEMESAHLRFVRDAVLLEDLRSSVIFEDPQARARSAHMELANHRFMAVSTSFQSLHHLLNRLQRGGGADVAAAVVALYRPLGDALGDTVPSRALLRRLRGARRQMPARAGAARAALAGADPTRVEEFDVGANLVQRFARELELYVASQLELRGERIPGNLVERARFVRSNDYAGAALATARTILTMALLALFWIATAWPLGSSAMLLATIFSGLFATTPGPVRTTLKVAAGYLAGMVAGFLCVFYVLTRIDGFPLLVACLLPCLMVGAYLFTRPTLALFGLGACMGLAYIVTITNPMVFNPLHFINDAVAQLLGLGAVVLMFGLVPPAIGSAWLRRRQLAALRGQVARAAEAPLPGLRYRFESVNRDLFHQIVGQTAAGSEDSRQLLAWALAVHETGRAIIELRHDQREQPLPPQLDAAAGQAIAALGRFFEQPSAAAYGQALAAVESALACARELPGESAALSFVRDHLHLIRLALVDDQSVMARYMPVTAKTHKEPAHAA
ncbi:MAG TPA: FUSC family protein [Stenotrophomonas sp.]|nr:FUSC family protein [Stenotrophomonas sp.]